MSENTFVDELDENEIPTSYTSATPAAATNRPALKGPGAGVGRRKEAVARVRLVPGTGRWVVNGKTLENYFPNKVHQQSVSEPFRTVDAEIMTPKSAPVSATKNAIAGVGNTPTR